MKKCTTPLIAILLLFCASYATAQTVTFSVGNITADRGQQICLPVSVSGFNQVLGFAFSLSYDPSALQFNSVTNFNLPDLTQTSSFGLPGNGSIPAGKMTVLWDDRTFAGISRPDGTTIFEVCFTVLNTANSTKVEFSDSPTRRDVFNPSGTSYTFAGQASSITVNGSGSNPIPFKLTAVNKTVTRGQQVCVDVTAEGFDTIAVMRFTLQYDTTRLQYNSVQGFNLPGLTAASFGAPGSTGVPRGRLTVNWSNTPTTQGVTRPAGAVLFQVCFTATNTGSAPVTFTNMPQAQVITKGSGAAVTFNGQNGTVTVNAPPPFKLIANNKTVTQGQQVCVDITAEGFDTIAVMRFTLQYDTTKLQYASVQGFNLPGLTAASFGVPGSTGVPRGRLTVNWANAPTTQGVTRAAGAVLFQVCFNTTAAGSAPISFTTTPQAQVVTKASGAAVTFNGQNGTVTVNSSGGGTTAFKVNMSDTTAASGAEVCLSITSEGFTDIATMSYTLQFDPARLQFVSTRQYNPSLVGFNDQSFGKPGNGGVPAGRLTVLWDDPAAQGLTLPDGTVLFQVCFKILATSGSSTVTFMGNPTPIEVLKVVNGNLQIAQFNSKAGTVTVGGIDPGPGDSKLRFSISDKQVQSGQPVCVDVTVDNFKDIIGVTLGVQYDPNKLQFVSVGQFGLPDLTIGQFGTPLTSPPTPAGLVTMVWFDNTLNGVTKTNGSIIFQLCFNAIAANGNTAAVTFTGTPTASMGADNKNEQPEPFTTKNGTITIGTVVDPGCTAPTLGPPVVTQVNCFGQSTGAINITPQGGSGSYTYRWSNNATTEDLTNIPAGTYTVTVTNANAACSLTVSATYTINQPATALAATSQITNIACGAGANSGAIILTTSGGTPPYQFNWSGTLPDNVTGQNNLPIGTYSVTITDNRGCMFALNNLNVTSLSTIVVNSVATNISQGGNNGAVALTITGGTGTFTYAWTGPNGYTSTQKDISGLSAAGQYCVTVTDAQGCTANRCTNVNTPLNVSVQTNRVCDGALDGAITLTVTGGIAPYTFRWGNGATTQNLMNVPAGSYAVTVTDSQNSSTTANAEISSYPALVLNAVVTPTNLGSTSGRIILSTTGGTGPYTIQWANNSTKDTLASLAMGSYCVTVTDSRGCKKNACYTVNEINAPLAIANIVVTRVSCPGANNGSVSFQITGGAPPYTIRFSDSTTITQNMGTVTKSNLRGGPLVYSVTDAVGTILRDTFEITSPVPVSIATVQVIHDSEEPGCTGRINLTLTGGSPPYQVQWNSPNVGASIINLCEGSFIPTVRDSSGCVQTLPAIEVTTFRASGTALAASCPQDTNGVITLNISGGTRPYTYEWRNTANVIISTADTLRNVASGVYTVRITDQSGNSLTRQFTVGSTSTLNANVEIISDYNGSDISCRNSTDGILEAEVTSGAGPYTYEWRRGTTVLASTPVLTGAGVGTYQVLVRDALGCTVMKQISIAPPDSIRIQANIREISCVGKTDGEILASASGGASGRPYNFNWNNNIVNSRISFLGAGTYQVTATDANGCIGTASFTLEEPKPIRVQVETLPVTGGCNGSVIAKVEGGTAPYAYRWNAPNGTTAIIDNLCKGSYSVAVTDSRGCTAATATGIVSDKENPCYQAQSIITPEDDGVNDQFNITCSEGIDNHLEIYNRWGQLVFQADNYANTWEGTTQSGDKLPEGPYYFVFEYIENGKLVQQKGSLTILRRK